MPLFRRIYERREKFRALAEANRGAWSMPDPDYDAQMPACCPGCGTFDRTWFSTLPAVWAVQLAVPACVLSFFVCLYTGLLADVGLEYRYDTQIPCLCLPVGPVCLPIPGTGTGCPSLVPANDACPAGNTSAPCGGGCFERPLGIADYLPEGESCIGGRYSTGVWELFANVWSASAGFQHAPRQCQSADDCYDGLPCLDGLCAKGPILKTVDNVFGFILTIGPVVVIPQLQMLVVGVLWLVPMQVHRSAQFLLAAHMLLAYSCLDVWVVTAAVRMPALYAFSVASQEETCRDLAEDPDAANLFDGVPDPCFGATGVLGEGFYWLIWPGVVQFWLTIYVSYEAGGIIVDHAQLADEAADSPFDQGGMQSEVGPEWGAPVGGNQEWRHQVEAQQRRSSQAATPGR